MNHPKQRRMRIAAMWAAAVVLALAGLALVPALAAGAPSAPRRVVAVPGDGSVTVCDPTSPCEELANPVLQACWTLQATRTDLAYGRTLPRRLRGLGLVDVAAEVRLSLAGPAPSQLHRTLIQRAQDRLIPDT